MNTTYTILPIQFSYLFDEPSDQVTNYLKRVPREIAIRLALYMSNYTENAVWDVQLNSLPLHEPIKWVFKAQMRIHESEFPNEQYVLFTPLTGLVLLKYIFTIPAYEHMPIGQEWQGNLIKAITLINSELLCESPKSNDSSFNRFFKSVKHFRYELDDRVLLYPAVYRCMCLLEFLEKNTPKIWNRLLSDITKRLNYNTIKDYIIRKLYLLEELNLNPKTSNQIFRFRRDFEELLKDAIPYMIEINNAKNEDFTEFKKRPFIQICNGEFAIIRNSFVANLIYNRLKFQLKESYVNNCNKNAQGFFGIFNKDFIERSLFLRILKYSFNSRKYICLSEDECIKRSDEYKHANTSVNDPDSCKRLMDGYVRRVNKILLLECKGKIISIRALSDEEEFKKDLDDIVGSNGVGQLIYNCERIIQNRCYWDNDIPMDYVIYPLLVLDDVGFSSDGFNRYVIELTKEYVDKQRGTVYQFTALDIDTFILISELIRNNQLDIFKAIEDYHTHNSKSMFEEKEISFATYLKANFETKSPKIVFNWLHQLNQ